MDEQLETVFKVARSGGKGLDRTFVVVGPAGSGKTTLLNAFAHKLGEGLVLFAAGSRMERDIEFGVLRQLMAHTGLPPAASRLVDRMAEADRLAPCGSASVRGRPGPIIRRSDARLLDELCHLLAKKSEQHPTVMIIDDAHEADAESLAAVTYLQRRFRLGRVVFVLAQLTPSAGRIDVNGDGQLTGKRLVLSPLSPAAVDSLVAAKLGRAWATAHAAEVDEITGGNPGLVTALVDDLAIAWRRRSPADRVVVGEMFTQAFLTYLHRFDPFAVTVAYRLALLEKHLTGETSTAEFLTAVTPSWADHVGRAVDELERAGLLHDGRFRHPAARAAVERGAREWAAEADGMGIATGLHLVRPFAGCADGEVMTVDRSRTRFPLDYASARPRLLDRTRGGGRRAGGEMDVETSAECAVPGRHHLCSQAAVARTFPAVASPDVPAPPVGTPEPWYEDPPPCRTADQSPRKAAGMSLHTADPSPGATGGLPQRDELFERFVPLVLRCADEQAARSRLSPSELAGRQALVSEAGRLVCQAEAKRRRGELGEAVDMVDTALRMRPAGDWGPALAGPLAVGIAANTAMGRLACADNLLRLSAEESLLETHFGLRLLWSVGQYRIARGQPGEALDVLFRCGQLMIGRGADLPDLASWRTSAAEAHIMLGNRRMARSLAEMELERAGREAPHTWGRALRVLASICPPKDRLLLLRESVQVLGDSGDRVELAHSLRALGRAYKRVGATHEANSAEARAMALARACGVQQLVDKPSLVEPADPAKQPVTQADSLTEAERKVATLAARGHTNREISKELFITMSTVEQHLTRIYRKLVVTGRAALIPLLADDTERPPGAGAVQEG
ncbi:AAA family ATPase [Streptomyces anulatus]